MNRRIRKKKRVDEFQEIGLEIEMTFADSLTLDAALDLFLEEAIDTLGLQFGGGGRDSIRPVKIDGFVELGCRSVAAQHLKKLRAWLDESGQVTDYVVKGIVDANYMHPVNLDVEMS